MKSAEHERLAALLQGVPMGTLAFSRNCASAQERPLFMDHISVKASGRGRIETYCVFPGIDASYIVFQASEAAVHHEASSALELFYCRSGRVGWNMSEGAAVYLGAGDTTLHSAACCADSAMMFPLGYAEGLSICMDFHRLAEHCPPVLRDAGIDLREIQSAFCSGKPTALPACPELNEIFAPLFSVRPVRRAPYLQLKVQELLLFLADFQPGRKELTQYFSHQTELVKEIQRQITEHLDQRFTIEALSKQYLINASTLKDVFKAVYGMPIATYMKEYRIRQAAKLLRETDFSISEIAGRVGYETQGKFSKAFKDSMQLLPTEYRKIHRRKPGFFA